MFFASCEVRLYRVASSAVGFLVVVVSRRSNLTNRVSFVIFGCFFLLYHSSFPVLYVWLAFICFNECLVKVRINIECGRNSTTLYCISSYSVIIRVRVVLTRTVVGD